MNDLTLHIRKKSVNTKPRKLYLYKQGKILETTDKSGKHYYLFFYKDHFINGVKADAISISSYLHLAIRDGISFDASHPTCELLLDNKTDYTLSTFNHLFKKLQEKYPATEMLIILSFFDSFIKPEKIQQLAKKLFYQYRRNGQLFNAYRMIATYYQFSPKDSFADDMVHAFEFEQNRVRYEDILTLHQTNKDPLYVEAKCFKANRTDLDNQILFDIYQEENRIIDALALHLATIDQKINKDKLDQIDLLISEHLPDKQQGEIWNGLIVKIKDDPELLKIVMEKLFKQEQYETLAKLLFTYDIKLDESQSEMIATLIEKIEPTIFSGIDDIDHLFDRLYQLLENNSHQLELVMEKCFTHYLSIYSVSELAEKLEGIENKGRKLPITEKIKKMHDLIDNPDQQLTLGELYLEFKQLEKAISCFEWEMELSPNDKKPLQYLYKTYQAMGNKVEANNFKQLLMNL
ncbi:tetratricopeptide repeat protein [Saliterribacillus persicus]|uniref:Uncharacterized protein n=1 Tax=Saliterribacillus persicus TaxID=930114 RepID=A0A368X4W6_9BACI|nr:hypothetical protein [Saliterribacillus persicus]RCW62983.1 hypothetical protein DFR57_12121 [Saliterribacillus persicus]